MVRRPSKTIPGRLLWTAVAVLLALWVLLAGLRHAAGDGEAAALGDRLWEVGVRVQMDNVVPGAVVRTAVPDDTQYIRLAGQRLVHPGWRLRFSSDPAWGVGRQTRLVATRADTQGFELGFTVHQSAAPLLQRPALRHGLSAQARERYLRSDALLGLEHQVVGGEVGLMAAGSESTEEMLGRIFSRARQLLPRKAPAARTVPEVLASGRASALERAYAMVALCRAANIPARLVTGVLLAEDVEAQLHHWVEVWDDGDGWLAYDPLQGYQREVPHNFLPFVRDRVDLAEAEGAGRIAVSYTVTNADEFLDVQAGVEPGWQSVFHLTRLPLEVRNVLARLFLLPLAVLLTTLFRELTGIRSYGTFMPALFALALVHAQWQMAAVTLGTVLLFGVLGRSVLPAGLHRQPRLTLVLILVVVGVATSISLMDFLAWGQDGRVVLLPVVIMAILVDLFYRALEKEGPDSAVVKLGWTLFQVVLCLPVMHYEALGHWLVAHPETHILTLAATLLVSGYSGPRLVSLPGFHGLSRPASRYGKRRRE